MGIEVTQMVRLSCDRCGMRQEFSCQRTHEAIEAAEKEGFKVSNWLHNKICPRQTCFCARCVQELLDNEAKLATP